MIRYALKCPEGHVFDSWFQSAAAFDALAAAGHLSCAECGAREVEKTLMAPKVVKATAPVAAARPQDAPQAPEGPPSDHALAEMRRAVEENATYVGGNFAEKAREMHAGTAPETSIYGEANAAEARALIEEGVPVVPLPFKPKQKLQ
ncbi:DUF1178 family protein [uncultured Sulfitobacter sp.]|uniref:DUF1178 family protein n=1 Tax=uncultured Sulfitobacter sp. TaxID=191468 RepID=UPI00260988BC|nr:DUF1178 family protein [uncultured Sulfitobacter sp.]